MANHRLKVLYNFAQLYRQPIFQLIDKTWDCKWYFGKTDTDIKEMDTSKLKDVVYVKNKKVFGPLVTQKGAGSLVREKDSYKILMLGEPMTLSTWWILLQRRLFFPNKKTYLWSHGWYGREGFFKKWLKRAFFGMADHVFTYGEYAKNVAISQGFDGNKITPIHNSLNHAEQIQLRNSLQSSSIYAEHFCNTNKVIIFIGRLTTVKRLDLLLEALTKLNEQGKRYNLVLIGSGEQKDNLENLTKKLGLESQVWFYGACYDDKQNAQLIYDADICVAPGNVGLTAMHSMVFGTPVLTHNDFSWQMPEFEAIRQGETGDFFKKGNPESIANSIQKWIESHSDREKVRKACYKEIDEKWSPEYQLNILKSVIG